MMIKKDGINKSTKANLTEAFKCGDCLHFKQTPHRTLKTVCCEAGVRSFALAPNCYTPDYTKVIHNADEFVAISTFFHSRTPQQKKILMGMLRQQPKGKKLRMGTRLYLNVGNRDYISNYLCGYVVGYTSGGDIVLAGAASTKASGRVFFAYLKGDESLFTHSEWKAKMQALLAKGRIQDPKAITKRDITADVKGNTYEVPTIDAAPKGTLNAKKTATKRKDLVEILSF
jgi:hypothetical protein